jgi:hypothetical protein
MLCVVYDEMYVDEKLKDFMDNLKSLNEKDEKKTQRSFKVTLHASILKKLFFLKLLYFYSII